MSRQELKDTYEVIVIGSGIGGLVAANLLAYRGVETLLVEQHSQVGGYFQGFKRKGFYFDSGIQSMAIKGVILPFLKQIKIEDKVKFMRSDYRIVVSNGVDITLNTLSDVEGTLCRFFPESTDEIVNYFKFYRQVINDVRTYNENGFPSLMDTNCSKIFPDFKKYWMGFPNFENIQSYLFTLAKIKNKDIITHPHLNNLLLSMGYPNMSIFSSAFFWYIMTEDCFYPIGGFQAFANLLAETFLDRGGTVAKNTLVEDILTENGKVVGVRTADGKEMRCNFVISNGDYKRTFLSLLKGIALNKIFEQKLVRATTSSPLFTLYLGLDMEPKILRESLKAHHIYYFSTYEFEKPQHIKDLHKNLPVMFSAPVLIDHSLAPKGKSTLILQTFSLYKWMNFWNIDKNGRKGTEYIKLKDYVACQLIEKAEKVIPGLSKKILWKESATPLTHEHYTLNTNGASAGWTWIPQKSFIGPMVDGITTPVKNLYCASHWALSSPGGSITSALAGKIAVDFILSRR